MADESTTAPSLTEADISRLASELGVADLDDEGDEPSGDGDGSQVGRQADEPKGDSDETVLPKPPTGQALVELVRGDPEAQRVIQQQLDNWLKQASADADAKNQSEKFRQLVEAGDYETIGKEYVQGLTDKAARERAEMDVYGEVYRSLFSMPELADANLTAEEREKLDHTRYDSDDAYIQALTDFVAGKRANSSIEERVTEAVNERIETLKNMKAGEQATQPSISSLPGGSPHNSNSEPKSSRDLITEGFRSMFEEASERVGEPVA